MSSLPQRVLTGFKRDCMLNHTYWHFISQLLTFPLNVAIVFPSLVVYMATTSDTCQIWIKGKIEALACKLLSFVSIAFMSVLSAQITLKLTKKNSKTSFIQEAFTEAPMYIKKKTKKDSRVCTLLTSNDGEGNSTPLQYSCLENRMDGGAWQAAVHGAAKSRTRLSDFTFTFHFHALEKEMATHSSVLAWRIPGTGQPGGLLSMGSHRVGHD